MIISEVSKLFSVNGEVDHIKGFHSFLRPLLSVIELPKIKHKGRDGNNSLKWGVMPKWEVQAPF